MNQHESTDLDLDLIRLDGGTQCRADSTEAMAEEYAEAMKEGAVFPAVTVFRDGADYWLADGFTRVEAARRVGLARISAEVREGTRRDAVLYAVGANATHGMRRTNADKRAAIARLLDDPEWSRWSDREIGRNPLSRPWTQRSYTGDERDRRKLCPVLDSAVALKVATLYTCDEWGRFLYRSAISSLGLTMRLGSGQAVLGAIPFAGERERAGRLGASCVRAGRASHLSHQEGAFRAVNRAT